MLEIILGMLLLMGLIWAVAFGLYYVLTKNSHLINTPQESRAAQRLAKTPITVRMGLRPWLDRLSFGGFLFYSQLVVFGAFVIYGVANKVAPVIAYMPNKVKIDTNSMLAVQHEELPQILLNKQDVPQVARPDMPEHIAIPDSMRLGGGPNSGQLGGSLDSVMDRAGMGEESKVSQDELGNRITMPGKKEKP